MKNNKGITLIALVVTIIVLLILAGVSIAMLSGQDGILNRASEASWQSKLANAEDTVNVYVSNYMTEFYAITYAGRPATAGITLPENPTPETVLSKAVTDANTALGSEITVSGPTSNKITITLTKPSAKVEGTVSGGIVTWGTMTKN